MTILHLTHATREAVLDMRAVQKAIQERGKDYCPALAEASRIVVAHARGEDPNTRSILSNADEPDGA